MMDWVVMALLAFGVIVIVAAIVFNEPNTRRELPLKEEKENKK